MADLKVLVVGAGGRMGRALIRSVADDAQMRLVAALDRPCASSLGQDAGTLAGIDTAGVIVSDDIDAAFAAADAVLDFSAPAASVDYARRAAERGLVHIVGTTGLSGADEEALRAAAGSARIVQSGNMSLGVNLVAGLVRQAAAALGPEFDIEILEMHHRHKVDAPSGTALLLGRAAAEGRRIDLAERSVRVRDGHTGPRPAGAIGYATLRGGSVIGEHTVILAGEGERIEITHRAEDRTIFARGAVRAALWAADQAPGFYSMADVLGLD